MNIPEGFVLEGQAQASALPEGFVLESAPVAGQIDLPIIGKPSLIGMAKSIWEGITLPRDVYQGEVDPLSDEGIARSMNLAGTIAVGGTGAPAGALGTGMVRPKPAPPTVKPQELMAAGAAGKKAVESSLFVADPKDVIDLVSRTRNALVKDSKFPENAPGMYATLDRMEKSATRALDEGGAFDANSMVGYRKVLTDHSKGPPSGNTAAAGLAKDVFSGWLRERAPTLAPMMEDYLGNFRAGFLGGEIASKANRASIGAKSTNSGMNVENRIRSTMGSILAKEDERALLGRRQNYTPETQALMREVSEGTRGENIARATGNYLGGGGGLGAALYGLGGLVANPALAAAPIAGWGIKTLANKRVLKKADKIAQSAMAASPLARQRRAAQPTQLPPQATGGLLGLLARNPQLLLALLAESPRTTNR